MMRFLSVHGTFLCIVFRVYVPRMIHKTGFGDVCCAPPEMYIAVKGLSIVGMEVLKSTVILPNFIHSNIFKF